MPPVWLLGALCVAWASQDFGPRLGAWAPAAGVLLVLAGLALIVVAALEFRRAKTTLIPGEEPSALVTSGIFRYSRNPIYLGDALILAGAVCYWQSVLGLILVPVFAWIIRTRFIAKEERLLTETYPTEFEAYRAGTRRWL